MTGIDRKVFLSALSWLWDRGNRRRIDRDMTEWSLWQKLSRPVQEKPSFVPEGSNSAERMPQDYTWVTLSQNPPSSHVEPVPTVVTNILGLDGQLTLAKHYCHMNLGLCIHCGQTGHLARACPKQAYRIIGVVKAYTSLVDHSMDLLDRSKNNLVVTSFPGEITVWVQSENYYYT